MATGVLIIGVDRATRLLTYVIGSTSGTPPRSGSASRPSPTTPRARRPRVPTRRGHRGSGPRGLAGHLTGEIEQVPSAVSAIKVDGQRAYKRVRAGEEVELPPGRVTVYRLDVLASGGSASGCSTWTSTWSARRAPTSGRSPATSARRSASAGT
jgi:tRNA pseudouridine55 synthase